MDAGIAVAGSEHILVVDDEAEVRELVREYLTRHGFEVSVAEDVGRARAVIDERANNLPVNLIVLDLRMPGEDGLSFARELRTRGDMGIVMLTASGDTIDRVVGLEVGADDYIPKPFDPRELLARIRSVLRRSRPLPNSPAEPPRRGIRFGRCLVDLEARRLFAPDGSEVPVTAMQFDLLEAFANHPNRVLSRDQLLDLANKRGNDPFDRSIDIRVARLRQKIEENPDKPQAIRTVHGVGYIFVPPGGPRAG